MAKLRSSSSSISKEEALGMFARKARAAGEGIYPSEALEEPKEEVSEEALSAVSKTNKRFQFGLTEWENEQIETMAKEAHISTASYARAIILNHIYKNNKRGK
jgi:hypothetical protein